MSCASPSRRSLNTRIVAGLFLAGLTSAAAVAPRFARAQAYPSKPIQLIVASAPGGALDLVTRQMAEYLGQELRQPVVVENKPGAGGFIAAELAARAQPDGYTLHVTWIGNATARTLFPRQNVDVLRDFAHITQMVYGSNVLVAHPAAGFGNLAAFLEHVKANPGRLNYASPGNASSGHLSMEMLKQRAGLQIVHVPYKGGVQALNDVLGGQMPAMFINLDQVLPHVPAGRLIPLAVTSPARSPKLPQVPTVAELGFSGFEATAWAGLSAPRGTPAAVIDTLHKAAVKAMRGPFRERQEAIGGVVVASDPAQFTEHVRREADNWRQVIESAGIKID